MRQHLKIFVPAVERAGVAAKAALENEDMATLKKILLKKNIALIGFMGTGKSTVCETMRQLGIAGVDTDVLVEQAAGMPVAEIFARQGEPAFREMETDAVRRAAQMPHTIISCGGGVVLREQNVEELRKHCWIVLLTAQPETILARLKDDDTRPKLRGRKTVAGIAELMAQRQERYAAAAQITVATDSKTPQQVCSEILAAVQR